MTQTDLENLAKEEATAHGLDPGIVCAVVEQESAWQPWSIRYEPAFYERYVAPLGLGPSEAQARSFSWGLMQIMGQVARELGYQKHLAALCDPQTGLDWGCEHLKHKFDQHGGDAHAALQAWNGGGNPDYADQVLARVAKYQ